MQLCMHIRGWRPWGQEIQLHLEAENGDKVWQGQVLTLGGQSTFLPQHNKHSNLADVQVIRKKDTS